jgi:Ca2+-binding RTX toxin-like protein
MRFSALIPLLVAVLGAAAPASAPAAVGGPEGACAEGPQKEGTALVGTPCDDRLVAGAGVTKVEGGAGDDVIVAPRSAADGSCPEGCRLGVGSQTFEGGPGNDIVYGERGNDLLRGGEGNDRLYGGIGDDGLHGGPGNDFLSGGFGADGIDGEAGGDFVRGDGTVDEIADSGPAGETDTLSYALGATPGFPDKAGYPNFSAHAGFPGLGGERGVYLNLNPATPAADNGVAPDGGGVDLVAGEDFERVVGTPFADYVVGAKPGISIYGGGGADVLIAEGAGAHLDGGADGDDCVGGATTASCESEAALGPVVPRDGSKTSVGLMAAPAEIGEAKVYAVGGSPGEQLTATYSAGPPVTVSFALSGGSFDQSASASAGCTVTTATQASCSLPGALDSVLIAGLGGDDQLQAESFPFSASVGILGGGGGDTLAGGEGEDMLVDGEGNDFLFGLGGDDIVVNNGGADRISAGAGNDLFLSDSICDGDLLNGGEGRDNASWAKFKAGVSVRLDTGLAGEPGAGGEPECGGGALDSLVEIEDLEGSGSADVFRGDQNANQLLGHQGPDAYFAEGGDDTILANSGDFDPTIDCGEGNDIALIDFAQYGDVAAPDCERVEERAPNSFRVDAELPPSVAPPPPTTTTPPRTPERAQGAPSNRFRVLSIVRNRRRGSAILRVEVPGAGRLLLGGRAVRPASRLSAGAAVLALPVRLRPRAARALGRAGRLRVVLTISFAPRGGTVRRERRTVTLSRAAPRSGARRG